MEVKYFLAFPCYDVEPCRLRDRLAVTVLVKKISHQAEVDHSVLIECVAADGADAAPEFDSVDVFHKIISLFVVKLFIPTSYARFVG